MKQQKLTRAEAFGLWLTLEPIDQVNTRLMSKLYSMFGGFRSKVYKDWAKTI